jgi:hypothetical protein
MCLFLIITSATAYGDDFFPESKINDLRVINASKEDGSALIIDKKGEEADIYIGDVIGIDRETVVAIEDAYITLQVDNNMVKIRVIKGAN